MGDYKSLSKCLQSFGVNSTVHKAMGSNYDSKIPNPYTLDRIPNFILDQNRPRKSNRHTLKPLVCRIGSLFCSTLSPGQFGQKWVHSESILGPFWAKIANIIYQ